MKRNKYKKTINDIRNIRISSKTTGITIIACEDPESDAQSFEKSIWNLINQAFNQKVS